MTAPDGGAPRSPCPYESTAESIATSERLTMQLLELVAGLEVFVAEVLEEAARRDALRKEGPRHA